MLQYSQIHSNNSNRYDPINCAPWFQRQCNMIGPDKHTAVVISAMYEQSSADLHNARTFENIFQNSVIHTYHKLDEIIIDIRFLNYLNHPTQLFGKLVLTQLTKLHISNMSISLKIVDTWFTKLTYQNISHLHIFACMYCVTRSSIYPQYVDPPSAVDGNDDPDLFNGSCSSTLFEAYPWISVDMGDRYYVMWATITNRIIFSKYWHNRQIIWPDYG